PPAQEIPASPSGRTRSVSPTRPASGRGAIDPHPARGGGAGGVGEAAANAPVDRSASRNKRPRKDCCQRCATPATSRARVIQGYRLQTQRYFVSSGSAPNLRLKSPPPMRSNVLQPRAIAR